MTSPTLISSLNFSKIIIENSTTLADVRNAYVTSLGHCPRDATDLKNAVLASNEVLQSEVESPRARIDHLEEMCRDVANARANLEQKTRRADISDKVEMLEVENAGSRIQIRNLLNAATNVREEYMANDACGPRAVRSAEFESAAESIRLRVVNATENDPECRCSAVDETTPDSPQNQLDAHPADELIRALSDPQIPTPPPPSTQDPTPSMPNPEQQNYILFAIESHNPDPSLSTTSAPKFFESLLSSLIKQIPARWPNTVVLCSKTEVVRHCGPQRATRLHARIAILAGAVYACHKSLRKRICDSSVGGSSQQAGCYAWRYGQMDLGWSGSLRMGVGRWSAGSLS